MSSNVVLSREGLFGETTAILGRCILESAIKVIWLCTKADDESFTRFIASGLNTELEVKKDIAARITEREGPPLEIEKRMLNSIQNYVNLSGLSEAEIKATKRLPNLASMIQTIGPDPLLYIVAWRVGSDPIHGTWSSLITHYLEEKDGEFKPATHRHATDQNLLIVEALIVHKALHAFVKFICREQAAAEALSKPLKVVAVEIHRIHREAAGNDFELVNEI
jgi:hypothetical protein